MDDPMLSPLLCWLKKQQVMTETSQMHLFRAAFLATAVLFCARSSRWWLVIVALILYRLMGTETFRRMRKTFRRDLKGLMMLIKVKRAMNARFAKNLPFHTCFLERVAEHPDKEAMVEIETGRRVTFRELNELSNQYANYFQAKGYVHGDVLALFMENGIDFVAVWLGLSKIGVVSAFINSNLKLEPLAHSIRVSKCKFIVTAANLLPTLKKAQSEGLVDKSIPVYLNEGEVAGELPSLHGEIKAASREEPKSPPGLDFQSVLCYIYTSGTTGNPKPAVIKHYRYFWMARGATITFDIRHDDRVYITMPIYHSAAGVMGIGSMLVHGTTIIIRKRFSASNFWKDAIQHKATCSQYIGELCRYLLAQKPGPEDRQHKIRLMWGNGLRGEIWTEFVSRFGVEKIGELYGSTEGNSNIVNIDNKVGACGFFPIYPFLTGIYPVRLVKVDPETGEVVRGKDGLAISCRPGDTGEMVGMIKNDDALLRFEGYVDKGDTAKKVYSDIFSKGDKAFASGDVLYWDELGYLYFRDRRGDTFRWKGENCSTTEVEGILQPVKEVIDCTVYGVEVGKMEGRAGMAALNLAPGVNVEPLLDDIAKRYQANLPAYAMPVFIRICTEVEKTGTYKLRKTDLQKVGFDLTKCNGDVIYMWSAGDKKYVQLTADLQHKIDSGEYTRL